MKPLKYILLVAALVCVAGCSLEENPDYFTNRKNFFKTVNQCRSAADACYLCINDIYTSSFAHITESCSDICVSWQAQQDAELNVTPSYPRFGATVWKQGYKGVMYCNFAIEGLEHSVIDEATRKEYIAESKIMRALYYYVLTCTFGDVPFYTVDVADNKIMEQVQRLPRTSATDIRRALIEDLEGCVADLPQIRGSEVGEYRAGAALGLMLIAKMAMWNGSKEQSGAAYWLEKAIAALEQLRAIYGSLGSYSLEENMLWYKKNTPESIFEIQHKYIAGGTNYTSSLAAVMHPQHGESGTDIFDGIAIPWLGANGRTWASIRPNTYFFRQLQPRGGADRRTAYNMAWEYNGVRFNSTASRPWMGIKFWCPDMTNYYDHNNYKIFRYADAVLMLAECYAETGKADKALLSLNEVKHRAGIALYSETAHDALIEEIRAERARELIGEFQRKFDLVRWGIWYERLMQYNNNTDTTGNAKPCHEYYPIPDVQCEYSGGALNNDEYKKYGL